MAKKIHIIGGGIMGLCAAYFLNESGCEVTIIDQSDLLDGTSHGNAGMVVPSHFVPLAAPGVISQGIKWMFDAKSPFFIKPRLAPDLIQWLWKFYRSCNATHVEKHASLLWNYNELSKEIYGAFAQKENFDFAFEKKGLLMIYQTQKQEESEAEHAQKAQKLGLSVQILDKAELRKLEPNITINAIGGVYFPDDAHLYPNIFIRQLISDLQAKGVNFLTKTKVESIQVSSLKIESITDQNGTKHLTQNVLFSSGSWTAKLLNKAGVKILLQDGKGYSITLKNPALKPEIPTILSEAKVAITPMGNDLRIGGTLEISNLTTNINKKRVQGITDALPSYYPDIKIDNIQEEKIWIGYRPCTPTGIPYLGKIPAFDNAFIATGHGMMGLSLGPATGKLISEIMLDKKTSLKTDEVKLMNL